MSKKPPSPGSPQPPGSVKPVNTGFAIEVDKKGAHPDRAICRPGRPVVWWTEERDDFEITFKQQNPCKNGKVENHGRFSNGTLQGGLANKSRYAYTIRFSDGTEIDPDIDIRF